MKSNIVLIGMPGAGKSTVGVLLAKWTARNFVDTDLLIQSHQGTTLQEIVDRQGYGALRSIEEQLLQTLNVEWHVIATGGSAVYSNAAMAHLKRQGLCFFLDVPLEVIRQRITDPDSRGVAKRPDQSLADLYDERLPLYRRQADKIVDCRNLDPQSVCQAIADALDEGW